MYGLPKTTEINKTIYKKMIYQKFPIELSGNNKDRFDADISRIVIVKKKKKKSVIIKATESVPSIFVVQIELKRKEYSDRNIILISKLFGQKLLLVLHYETECQLAIFETRLLKSDWMASDELILHINGLDLSTVWDGFVTQISGIHAIGTNTLDEQIQIEAEKDKIRKQIDDLERKARKEIQSKKKYELFQMIKEKEKKLEDM